MVFSDRSASTMPDLCKPEEPLHCLPTRQSSHGKEEKENVLGFEFGNAPAIILEEPRL